MASVKRVIIYGDSIFLSAIAEILRAEPDLGVVEVRSQDGQRQLEISQPDIVVVDASQTTLEQVSALMASFNDRPGLSFISLDPNAKGLTVLSSRQFPAVSLPDLTHVIKNL